MKKSELVSEIAARKSLTAKDASKIISIIIEEITQSLFLGERAEFRGFGVFTSRIREEREGRNPKTGNPIKVKRKRIPHFKMAKQFFNKVNN